MFIWCPRQCIKNQKNNSSRSLPAHPRNVRHKQDQEMLFIHKLGRPCATVLKCSLSKQNWGCTQLFQYIYIYISQVNTAIKYSNSKHTSNPVFCSWYFQLKMACSIQYSGDRFTISILVTHFFMDFPHSAALRYHRGAAEQPVHGLQYSFAHHHSQFSH